MTQNLNVVSLNGNLYYSSKTFTVFVFTKQMKKVKTINLKSVIIL